MNQMIIKIYSVPDCPYCQELKGYLTSDNIPFTDVDVSLKENEDEYKKINMISKCDEVPIVRVNKQLLVPNRSFRSIQEAFELTKRFYNEEQ